MATRRKKTTKKKTTRKKSRITWEWRDWGRLSAQGHFGPFAAHISRHWYSANVNVARRTDQYVWVALDTDHRGLNSIVGTGITKTIGAGKTDVKRAVRDWRGY